MLFDPSWAKKQDPFSLTALIAWLKTKPANKPYLYSCVVHCLMGQWVKSMDKYAQPSMGGHSFQYTVNGRMVDLLHYHDIACGNNNETSERTFGAALQRAEALLAKQQKELENVV